MIKYSRPLRVKISAATFCQGYEGREVGIRGSHAGLASLAISGHLSMKLSNCFEIPDHHTEIFARRQHLSHYVLMTFAQLAQCFCSECSRNHHPLSIHEQSGSNCQTCVVVMAFDDNTKLRSSYLTLFSCPRLHKRCALVSCSIRHLCTRVLLTC